MITIGLDEVGRGSWAGPLVAGAVILDKRLPDLKDSKLLTGAERLTLAKRIYERSLASSLGWVTAAEIDKLGLSASLKLAMERALAGIEIDYDEIIIDGKYNCLPDNPKARAVIKADNKIAAVSAASIIAKVARDQYMTDMAKVYPGFGFDRHVGYGTALHRQQLKHLGTCQLHRLSFKPLRAL